MVKRKKKSHKPCACVSVGSEGIHICSKDKTDKTTYFDFKHNITSQIGSKYKGTNSNTIEIQTYKLKHDRNTKVQTQIQSK